MTNINLDTLAFYDGYEWIDVMQSDIDKLPRRDDGAVNMKNYRDDGKDYWWRPDNA